MGSLGVQEMAVIAVLALLVFGPDRLPEVARNAAKLLARFREETAKSLDELKRAADVEDVTGDFKRLQGEFRGLKGQIDKAKSDLTGALDLTGTGAQAAGARATPPPFDPDAT